MTRVGLFGQISDINDHLFLSGAGVMRPEKMRQKKITCVINATTEEPNAYLPGVECLKIRIEDSPFAKLDSYFDMVADKIKSVKDRGGKTLVHCVAGVSRSASLCIVYLVKYEKMSLRQAYHYVKSARPIIRPNIGFWRQMVEYEKKLRGHSTVTMIPVEGCALPFPDVYSSDLRKHLLTHPGPAHNDPQLVKQQKQQHQQSQSVQNGGVSLLKGRSTIIPIEYAKRRGLSVGNMDGMRHRHSNHGTIGYFGGSSSNSSGSNSSGGVSGASSADPWRHVASISMLSPVPARRAAALLRASPSGNIFTNIYNTSRETFFPTF